MLNVDFTFLWTAVNLVILYFFLRKFLFGRVGKFMDDRAAAIAADKEKAAADQAESQALLQKHKAMMDTAEEDRKSFLAEARTTAAAEKERLVAEAKQEAAKIVQSAHSEVEAERERMMGKMRDEVASLALAAATKVVEANMDNEKNRSIVDEFLDSEGVA